MYSLFDVYKQLILITRYNRNIYFDNYINRYIFSFLENDYKEIINNYYLDIYLNKLIPHSEFLGNPLKIYFDSFPYSKIINKLKFKRIIDSKLNINTNLYFYNYLPKDKGIYYENLDNYYKLIFDI